MAAEEAANADAEVTEAVSIRDRRAAFEKKTAPADSVAKAPAPSARFQSSAPKCPACGKSVFAAEEVKGLGQSWHVLCFCCKACGKSLRGGQYKDHDGQPYCEADYNKLYGPKGIGFGATLGDTGIAAAAGASSTEVPSEGYAGGGLKEKMAAFEGQGTPKAKVDVAQTDASPTRASKGFVPFSAPKCPACGKSVFAAEEVKGLGQSWHALCFCCKACGKSLRGGQYKDHEGHPYCEADYNKLFGPKGIGFGATLGDTGIAAKAPEEGAPASSPEGGYASALKDRMAAFEGQKPVPGAADETAEADKSLAGMAKSALQPAAPKCPACSKSVYAAEQILGSPVVPFFLFMVSLNYEITNPKKGAPVIILNNQPKKGVLIIILLLGYQGSRGWVRPGMCFAFAAKPVGRASEAGNTRTTTGSRIAKRTTASCLVPRASALAAHWATQASPKRDCRLHEGLAAPWYVM